MEGRCWMSRRALSDSLPMAKNYTASPIDGCLRERLMPVEDAIPHVPGIELCQSKGRPLSLSLGTEPRICGPRISRVSAFP